MNTQIYAHRGASGYAPENTLEAFELAAKILFDKAHFFNSPTRYDKSRSENLRHLELRSVGSLLTQRASPTAYQSFTSRLAYKYTDLFPYSQFYLSIFRPPPF